MAKSNDSMEANFSVLAMSIASSAAMALGLAPDPQSGKAQKDMALARFNVDLLMMLQAKTKGNLTSDESRFLDNLIQDLQIKVVQNKG